ncbi:hypothetical protein AN958_12653 [Leucoagaricus sp. SymC.cos]|nr:hypothetical protein AN958_12653 [Leucoagaricus sp. SymC.cos]
MSLTNQQIMPMKGARARTSFDPGQLTYLYGGLEYLHITVSCKKAYAAQMAENGTEEVRKSCVGHGYLALPGFPDVVCNIFDCDLALKLKDEQSVKPGEAWNTLMAAHPILAAHYHVECVVLEAFIQHVARIQDDAIRRVMEHLYQLCALIIIESRDAIGSSTFLEDFINDAYGSRILASTGSMRSDTEVISYVTPPLSTSQPSYPNIRDIHLVDTIGLSGSSADHNRTVLAAKWIKIFCPTNQGRNTEKGGPLHPTVKGFLYFIDISDEAGLNADNLTNLKFFQKLVGQDPDILKSVAFVTTKWQQKENKSLRRGQERRLEEWKKTLEELFPGCRVLRLDGETSRADIEELDESLEENQTSEAKERIAREKTSYTKNVFTVLNDVLVNPAKVASKLEHEIKAINGGKRQMKDIGIGQVALEEAKLMAMVLDEAGDSDLAEIMRSAADEFHNTKVKDAEEFVNSREQQRSEFMMRVNARLHDFRKGNEAFANAVYESTEAIMNFWSLVPFVGPKQKEALQKAFDKRMVKRTSGTVGTCAVAGGLFGKPGRYVGAAFGAAVSAVVNVGDGSLTTLKSGLSK